MLPQKYSEAWHAVLVTETISTSAPSDFHPSLWAAGQWMTQWIVPTHKIKRWHSLLKFGIVWMLCHALLLVYCVTLVNSFLLTIFVPPAHFFWHLIIFTFGHFCTFCLCRTQHRAALFLAPVTVAEALVKRKREALLSGCSSVLFPLHSRGDTAFRLTCNLEMGRRKKKKWLFSKWSPCCLGVVWVLLLGSWTLASVWWSWWLCWWYTYLSAFCWISARTNCEFLILSYLHYCVLQSCSEAF